MPLKNVDLCQGVASGNDWMVCKLIEWRLAAMKKTNAVCERMWGESVYEYSLKKFINLKI